MRNRKIVYGVIIVLFVLSLILAAIIFQTRNQKLEVVFLNVGQGDAILIQKGSIQILIDGGASSQKELEEIGKYIPFWDRTIEAVIATHPDQDHIGGLIGVMKNYKVANEISTEAKSDSEIYKAYKETVADKKIEHLKGERGMNLKLGDDVLSILYPGADIIDKADDTNADSIVAKLTAGEKKMLLTGDFPTKEGEKIFSSGVDLSADILKVAHHGSKYATSEAFLDRVKPKEAIISVGEKNRYGHPAAEVLERLKGRGVRVLRTDEAGDIVYNCSNDHEECFENIPGHDIQ